METSFKPGFVSLNDINFDPAKAGQLYLAHIRGVHQCLSLTMDMSRRDRQRHPEEERCQWRSKPLTENK